MFCTSCGAKNDESNMFCTVCGAPLEHDPAQEPAATNADDGKSHVHVNNQGYGYGQRPMDFRNAGAGQTPMSAPQSPTPQPSMPQNPSMVQPMAAPGGAAAPGTPGSIDVGNTINVPGGANANGGGFPGGASVGAGMPGAAAVPAPTQNRNKMIAIIAAFVAVAFVGGIAVATLMRQNDSTSTAQSAQSSQSPVYGGSDEASAGTPEQTMGKVVSVSAGGSFDLAVDANGKAWAWGYNGHGQLGSATGSDSQSTKPVQVAIKGTVTKVAAGTDHGLALTSDGSVWAWGANDHGQVGDGSAAVSVGKPTKVTGLSGVTDIDAGDRYSLALKSDGTVWSWGYGDGGRTGHGIGNSEDTLEPQQIAGLSGVIDIGAGTKHGIALTNSGEYTTWTWGGGSNTDGPVPIPNAGDVAAVDAGNQYSIVLHRDGTVHGWGQNDKGQLGDGNPKAWQAQLVDADGMPSITAISAGDSHVLALGSDGSVWAWGLNDKGQLGSGSGSSTVPVQVGVSNATAIGAGGSRSVAATSDGQALSWGDGTSSPTEMK